MLQYPNSYDNAFLSKTGGGVLFIGKNGAAPFGDDVPSLRIEYGNMSGVYTDQSSGTTGTAIFGTTSPSDQAAGLHARRWYHLAITVDANGYINVYINGTKAARVGAQPGGLALLTVGSSKLPMGTLRIGQSDDPTRSPMQYFGLLDDIGIWNRTLTNQEVLNLSRQVKLTGNESGLLAGWNFDIHVGGAQPPPRHDGRLTYTGNARVVWPTARSYWADLLPQPAHQSDFRFPINEVSKIAKGADMGPGNSHRGYASFCLDVSHPDDTQSARGWEIRAMARGKVIFIRDTSPDKDPLQKVPGCTPCPGNPSSCNYLSNEVVLEHGPGDYTGYVHLMPGSVPASVWAKLGTDQYVEKGDVIGKVGRSGTEGNHLHVGHMSKVVLVNGDNGTRACRPGVRSIPGFLPYGQVGIEQATRDTSTPLTTSTTLKILCTSDTPVTTGKACGYTPAVTPFETMTSPFRVHYLVQRNGKFVPELKTPEIDEIVIPGPY